MYRPLDPQSGHWNKGALKLKRNAYVFLKTTIFCSLHNEECELLQKSNESELDAVLGLRWKLLQAKKENLDLTIQHNQEVRTSFSFALFYPWNKCCLVSLK